jgi:hypothetical protein
LAKSALTWSSNTPVILPLRRLAEMNEAQVATISWSAGMVDAIGHRHVGNPYGSTSRA